MNVKYFVLLKNVRDKNQFMFLARKLYPENSTSLYRLSQEECARLREGVPYAKLYRYNPKYLSPNWNGYGDNDQRQMCSSCGSTHRTCRLTLSLPSSLNVVSHDELSAGRWAVNFTA